MLPTRSVIEHLKFTDQDLVDIVLELRNIIALAQPDVTEEFLRGGMTYYDARKGGHVSAGICLIQVLEREVRLAFIHGAFLPDPRHLLIDEGGRKAKRYLRLTSYQEVPWEAVGVLIHASVDFDPYSLAGRSPS